MELKWKSAYETGVEDVDLQHHYFINLVNRIGKDLYRHTDQDHRARLINELIHYAQFHFASEENIAYSLGRNTGLDKHRARHSEILIDLRQKATDMLGGGSSVDDFLTFLYNWFAGHTVYEDRPFFNPDIPPE
jgi:hemerythrin